MDIKDIQSARRQLQDQISTMLTKFSADTGLSVNAVDVEKLIRMGEGTGQAAARYLVSIEVKL